MAIQCAMVALAAAFLAGATGCASVSYSSPGAMNDITIKGANGAPEQLVLINVSGYYLLWTIPLISGDLRWNESLKSIEGGSLPFRDLVGVDELQTALTKIAESRNCDLMDVCYNDSDTSYAGASYEGAIGALFGLSQMSVSAVLVPHAQPQKETAE